MTFIKIVPEDQASGLLAELYDEERADDGYVWNGTKAFSHRPEVRAGWDRFMGSISANMDHRRYELATLAAARRLRSSYCMLAHGSVVLDRYMAPDELRAVATDHRDAGLDPVDVAVMDFADFESARVYVQHPVHQTYVREHATKVVGERVVVQHDWTPPSV